MHTPPDTPPSGFRTGDDELRRRLRKITTLSRWQDRMASHNAELTADLDAARALVAAYQQLAGDQCDPPPPQFAHALRTGRRRVHVAIDGQAVIIGLCPTRRPPDPLAECRAWRAHVEVHRRVRAERIVPEATGLRLAELPDGHRYQAWRGVARIVVVNIALPGRCARNALRGALTALRAQAVILPWMC